MPHAGCRIGRVRPKDKSAELVILPAFDDRNRAEILRRVRIVLDCQTSGYAGFAFVVWGPDNGSTCDAMGSEMMPSILLPDFVRSRLLAARFLQWAHEDMLDALGYPNDSA